MKKGTKIGLGVLAFLGGAILLTGCTNSFCSKVDKAHILYAFDHGVTYYYDKTTEADTITSLDQAGYKHYDVNAQVTAFTYIGEKTTLKTIITNAEKSYFATPTLDYYVEFDKKVLNLALEAANADNGTSLTINDLKAEDIKGIHSDDNQTITQGGLLDKYGFLKFYEETSEKNTNKLWIKWNAINNEIRTEGIVDIDECPTTDFASFYQSQMNSKINAYRSCIALKDGYYGNYGNNGDKTKVFISGKDWGYAWKTGPLSGLLVYPISAAIDWLTSSMLGVGRGWAQLIAILIVTVVVRGIMLAATFKQTTANSKMQALQPELAKIQAKYPNSNTNNYDKQRLAEETQRLYKKHGINPLGSLLIMFVQFPVFICVWSAMQGSAWLSSDAVLGLNLSDSISSILTTWSNWRTPVETGVITALVLFLLMSGAQVVSMLLPQWLQKKRLKNVQKLGRNPAQNDNSNKMKWFTYIMLVMIIIMGFSLASAMGVYWLIGALISIVQTVITNAVMNKKRKTY
ncbi:MAG: membrane protein insertase YidC [Bacilli bacterium]|nr:membrane protein insertase YidC [Bacilli bacterium]